MRRIIFFVGLMFPLPACSDSNPIEPSPTIQAPSAKKVPKPGKAAYALEFSGDQWMQSPYTADLNLGSTFTLEVWIKPSILSGIQDLVNRWGYGTAASFSFNIKDATVNLSTRQESQDPQNTYTQTASILTVGEWQHIAVSFDNGTVRIYLNGELKLAESGKHVPQDNTQFLAVGREAGYEAYYFHGQMDDVRIWSTARTQSQIAASMKNVRGKDKSGLIAWWKMDEGTGDIAYDAIGNHDMQLGDASGSDAGDPVWVKEPKKR